MERISIAQLKRQITGRTVSFVNSLWDMEERLANGKLKEYQIWDCICDGESINKGVVSFNSQSMIRTDENFRPYWYRLKGSKCTMHSSGKYFILSDGRTACLYRVER